MAKKSVSQPLVSVIIPAYNATKYIGEAIESILDQTYKNIEVIIIDDKSTDKTLEIIESYQAKDNRIKVYKNKKNLGIGANRTKGISLSRGVYICWQDADDISLPDRIESQVDYLETRKEVGVVGGYIEFMGEDGKTLRTRRYGEDDESLRRNIFRYNPVAQPASMFRKAAYEIIGTYNESYKVSEDLDLLFRLGTQFKFANVQKVVVRYRQLDASLTRSNLRKMESVTLALRKHYSRHEAYHFGLKDRLFNYAQQLSMFMPVRLRLFLFQLIRGDK